MKKPALKALTVIVVLYAVLLIPDPEPVVPPEDLQGGTKKAFAWNQDAFWTKIENQFVEARAAGCVAMERRLDSLMDSGNSVLKRLQHNEVGFADPSVRQLENSLFMIGAIVPACPDRVSQFTRFVEESRQTMKRQSEGWDVNTMEAREALYRVLYGGRGAVEEVLLQFPADSTRDPLSRGTDEPSETPWAIILGVKIHSGDILVSRGGAPTSALIARGNDFPGNFSHIALVYVDPKTRLASIVESHIERGVVISTLEDYLKDIKLRVMVLRPRSDLPQIQNDPMLPHRAAEAAVREVRARHIPYDFTMDFQNPDTWFCSEVASFAYKKAGLQLWMGLSHLSSPGLRAWLAGFGVRHFETEEPSDLEYDPQLRVVAEWRDPDQLRKDHADNAVTEAMLEGAEAGDRLSYAWYLLPVGRAAKAYSFCLNFFGKEGPVPEGMSATSALKNKFYSGKHDAIKLELTTHTRNFKIQKGYTPPYWRLLQMARAAKQKVEAQ
jgi:hypothetical protein